VYTLGSKSLSKLVGVDSRLVECVKEAIVITECDFSVTDGLRTAEQQNALFQKGASKKDGYINKSFHQTGFAVDLVPYINGQLRWEVKPCMMIADAMRTAGEKLDLNIRWGGTWTIITNDDDNIEDLVIKNPTRFFDGPHYELR